MSSARPGADQRARSACPRAELAFAKRRLRFAKAKAVDVKVTTLTSRKKPEAETAAAEILERIDGVLEGDDFPALPTLPHSSSLGLGQVVPRVGASLSSVFAGSDSPGPHQA